MKEPESAGALQGWHMWLGSQKFRVGGFAFKVWGLGLQGFGG